ncbi:MAG: hypothetical protein V7L23_13345 [Nostoc sp.]
MLPFRTRTIARSRSEYGKFFNKWLDAIAFWALCSCRLLKKSQWIHA